MATQTWQRWSEMYARRRPSLPLSAWEFRGPLEEDAVGRGSAGGSGSRRSPGNADPVIAAAEADSPNFRSGSPPELDPEPRASRCPRPPSPPLSWLRKEVLNAHCARWVSSDFGLVRRPRLADVCRATFPADLSFRANRSALPLFAVG